MRLQVTLASGAVALADGVAKWTLDQHNCLALPAVTFMDWRREELPNSGWCATDARQAHCQVPGAWGQQAEAVEDGGRAASLGVEVCPSAPCPG